MFVVGDDQASMLAGKSYGKPFLPGFWTFPGIWILWNKYTGFGQGASKIVVNGRIHCELQIRVQVFENSNQRKFCGPLNIKSV